MRAWHQRQISRHLAQLVEVRDQAGDPGQRLAAVLDAYALIAHHTRRHPDTELVALLHANAELAQAQHQLHALIRQLLVDAAETGHVRKDVSADELASYSMHALAAASGLGSQAAVRRLVAVTLAGLRPPRRGGTGARQRVATGRESTSGESIPASRSGVIADSRSGEASSPVQL